MKYYERVDLSFILPQTLWGGGLSLTSTEITAPPYFFTILRLYKIHATREERKKKKKNEREKKKEKEKEKNVALVSALCILALATFAHSHPSNVFDVEGDVYCDPCRVQFETPYSQKLSGATVKLECLNIDKKAVTYSVEGVTDANGHYRVRVEGEHENDICEVNVVKSPREDCSETMAEVEKPRIECTENSGMHNDVRLANPIGFMTKEVLPECLQIIDELKAQADGQLID